MHTAVRESYSEKVTTRTQFVFEKGADGAVLLNYCDYVMDKLCCG